MLFVLWVNTDSESDSGMPCDLGFFCRSELKAQSRSAAEVWRFGLTGKKVLNE